MRARTAVSPGKYETTLDPFTHHAHKLHTRSSKIVIDEHGNREGFWRLQVELTAEECRAQRYFHTY